MKSQIASLKLLGCACGALFILSGCVTPRPQSSLPLTGDPLVDGPMAISGGPARDKVLWQYRVAAADMRQGRFTDAKRMLDDALLSLGGMIVNDKGAKQARSLFHTEAKKTFLGEPYERVMAFYYRGILYWMDGEPDNARACFRSAQIEDSDTENKLFASDYVLLDYLDGLASVKLAADGSDALKRAKSQTRFAAPPPYDPRANVLFFLEYGRGPTKYATGQYHEELRFQPGRSPARSARIKVDDQSRQAGPYDDLTFQATTRGGRVMDHILANKAVFKSASDTVGNVALIGGAAMAIAGQGDVRNAGIGLAAFGLVSKLVSSATTPAADTRCWDNLPQYLSFTALRLPPGEHTATVEFWDEGGRPISNLTKTVKFKVTAPNKDTVLFISDQSLATQSYENN